MGQDQIEFVSLEVGQQVRDSPSELVPVQANVAELRDLS